jgi:hypothetical protein
MNFSSSPLCYNFVPGGKEWWQSASTCTPGERNKMAALSWIDDSYIWSMKFSSPQKQREIATGIFFPACMTRRMERLFCWNN